VRTKIINCFKPEYRSAQQTRNIAEGFRNYLVPSMRNGNKSMAPISLNINPTVSPTILKGSSTNHIMGKRTIMTSANGQQTTNNRHHNINAIKVFIQMVFVTSKQIARQNVQTELSLNLNDK
jgi:hypothetical protein